MSYNGGMKLFSVFLAAGTLILSGCATGLYKAAESGNVAEVNRLLGGGTPADQESGFDNVYHYPLGAAVRGGHAEIVRALLEKGAKTNQTDSDGFTALRLALINPNLEIIRLLLDHGADPLQPRVRYSYDKSTPLEHAMNHYLDGRPDIDEIRRLMAEAAGRLKRKQRALESLASGEAAPPAPPAAAAPVPSAPAAARLQPAFAGPEAADDYAVIVGIENYPDLPAATYAERDAAAAKEFVHALGVPERNIVLLTGSRATKTGIEKTVEDWLPNNVSEKSRVYFFYSGHGAPDPKTGSAYLLPSDGDPQYLARTGYPLKELYFQLGQSKAKSVLIALDSCFSGAGGRSVIAKGTRPLVGKVDTAVQPEGKVSVLSASAGDQTSGADDAAGYGLFTYNLLQGLNGAAKDGEGRVTLKSLYGYLKPRVQDDARRANRDQTPQLQGGGVEELVLRAK